MPAYPSGADGRTPCARNKRNISPAATIATMIAANNSASRPANSANPFPGNILPASRIDTVANTLVNLYPNPQNSNLATNFIYQGPVNQDCR